MNFPASKPYTALIPQLFYHGSEDGFHFDASRQKTTCIFFAERKSDARSYAGPHRRARGRVFTCSIKFNRLAEFKNEYELISYGQGYGEPIIAYRKAGPRLHAAGFDGAVILDNAAGGVDFVVWNSALITVICSEPY